MTWAEIPGWFDWSDILDEAVSLSRDGDVMIEIGSTVWSSSGSNVRASAVRTSMRGLTGTPQGLAVQCMATPVLMLSWKRMNLPADASVQPLDGLPKGEREEIEKAIKNAAGFAEAMRAQNAGIALVPPGAKLPPLGAK